MGKLQGVSQLVTKVIPPFIGHVSMNQAALLRAERAMDQVWFFEKRILKFIFFVIVRSRYKLRLVFRLSQFAASSSSSSLLVFNFLA